MTTRRTSSLRDLKKAADTGTVPRDAADAGPAFTLFAHESPALEDSDSPSAVQSYGSSGAVVSAWAVDRRMLTVVADADAATSSSHVYQWDEVAREYFPGAATWDRLCSADLTPEKALRHGQRGTAERLFLTGEKVGSGRAWARIATGPHAGDAWELPRLGRMSFANLVACPHGRARTIVALFDVPDADTAAPSSNRSRVFIYVGTKQSEGNEIERAGLTNGRLFGVRVYRGQTLVTEETIEFGLGNVSTGYIGSGRFELVPLATGGDVSGDSAPQPEQAAIPDNVFRMHRAEAAAWNASSDGNHALYFVTTDSNRPGPGSRLWCLLFDNVERPEQGGRIEILLTRRRTFDSITIDKVARILVQENTGDNPRVSQVHIYNAEGRDLRNIASHDPGLLRQAAHPSPFIDEDEDSAGMIDAQHIFGQGWFLLDAQNHSPALTRSGQILALHVHPWMRKSFIEPCSTTSCGRQAATTSRHAVEFS
jgi:hypothetical protein